MSSSSGSSAINSNLVTGAVIAATVGLIVGYIGAELVLDILELRDGVNLLFVTLILAIAVGWEWFRRTLHTVPVGHRGVLLILGTRYKTGAAHDVIYSYEKDSTSGAYKRRTHDIHYHKGLQEGLVSTILPAPLGSVVDVDCRRKDLKYTGMEDVYSKDNVLVRVDGVKQYQVRDPYVYLDSENPEDTLLDIGKRAIRAVIRQYTALDAPHRDRKELSEQVEQVLISDLLSDPDMKDLWGLQIDIIRLNNIRLDAELEKALRQRVQEGIEADSEDQQVKARVSQLTQLTATGVSANVAAAMAMIDAGKPGANLSVFSGLEGSGTMVNPQTGQIVGTFPGAGGKPQKNGG